MWAALGRRGTGEPQRARGAASLDPSWPVVVSEKVVRRAMAEEGLAARRAAPGAGPYSSSYAGEKGLRKAPNLPLVNEAADRHDFRASAPGKVLVTDITELTMNAFALHQHCATAILNMDRIRRQFGSMSP